MFLNHRYLDSMGDGTKGKLAPVEQNLSVKLWHFFK